MPTYITLYRWTQQGVQNVKESPSRVDAARSALREIGAELKAIYLTMGQYDFVAVWEAPDDETAARATLGLASQGNVRSETLRAFGEDEYRKIIGGLS